MEKMADVLRKDLNIIVDVGGNCGIFAYFVKKRHPQAKLYIFEPSEHLNQVIKHNLFAFEKWEIIQKVVSDSDNKELEFYINPCSQQTNSLIKENVLPFTTNDSIIKENVKSITIDRFCRENNINHIDLLKVDIQGHEYYMLEGAKESLAKTEYAIFEMSFLDKNILKTLQVLDVYFEISQIINEVKYGADILFKRKNEKN
ncbi:FkbM family methyltransferase [Methanococcoides sp. AM1]|uniref:FkbM family methyltransferase n=1 Tax=Methanococcoides sp. AM1 TaxID=1201011 RepID=UPI00143869FD|nr:FkbM family methyltransferase [Methanococcoides sp. AM1]